MSQIHEKLRGKTGSSPSRVSLKVDLSTNTNYRKRNASVHSKGGKLRRYKGWLQKAGIKGGNFTWRRTAPGSGLSADTSCQVSGDADAGGVVATDAILLLKVWADEQSTHRVRSTHKWHTNPTTECSPDHISDKLDRLHISNSSAQTNANALVQKSGKNPTIIPLTSRVPQIKTIWLFQGKMEEKGVPRGAYQVTYPTSKLSPLGLAETRGDNKHLNVVWPKQQMGRAQQSRSCSQRDAPSWV